MKLFRTLFTVAALAAIPLRAATGTPMPARPALVHRPGSGRPDLERMKVADLRNLATTLRIRGRSKARRKAQLVALIAGALA